MVKRKAGVDERCQHLEPVEPEGMRGVAAHAGELDCRQGHAQPDHVGRHVAGVGKQGERAEPDPRASLDQRVGEREEEGD